MCLTAVLFINNYYLWCQGSIPPFAYKCRKPISKIPNRIHGNSAGIRKGYTSNLYRCHQTSMLRMLAFNKHWSISCHGKTSWQH